MEVIIAPSVDTTNVPLYLRSKSTYDNVTPEDFMIAMLALPALFMVSIVLCIIMKQRKNPDQPDPR